MSPPSESDVVFATAVESLYLRGLKDRLTPELRDAIRGLGIDLDRPLLPGYGLDTWAQALRVTAATLFPGRTLEQATAEMGRITFNSLRETTIGMALFPIFRLIGPRRVLQRMTRSLRNGSNFIETKVVAEADGEADVWFNRVREVGFYTGVLEAGVIAAGARDAAVTVHSRQGDEVVYRVRWS